MDQATQKLFTTLFLAARKAVNEDPSDAHFVWDAMFETMNDLAEPSSKDAVKKLAYEVQDLMANIEGDEVTSEE